MAKLIETQYCTIGFDNHIVEKGTTTNMAQLKLTHDILAAALEGFEVQKQRLDDKISEIRGLLDGGSTGPAAPTVKPRRKRSAAIRRRMKAAQQLRWQKIREAAAPPQAVAKKPKKKRKMSAAGRKAISEATKKRWAAVKAAKKVAA
jgi:hypothetical protein